MEPVFSVLSAQTVAPRHFSDRSQKSEELRWTIDALPDPTQLTENPISAEVEVRHSLGTRTEMAVRRPTARNEVILLGIVAGLLPNMDRAIHGGATAGSRMMAGRL